GVGRVLAVGAVRSSAGGQARRRLLSLVARGARQSPHACVLPPHLVAVGGGAGGERGSHALAVVLSVSVDVRAVPLGGFRGNDDYDDCDFRPLVPAFDAPA